MRRLIVLIVALGLVAAACGSSDDSSEQADTPSTTEGTDAPSTTQGPGLTLPPVTNPTVTAAPTTEPPDTGGAPAASPIAVQLAEWSVVAPTNIAAGTVEFGVENLGVFSHEFAIARGDSYETLPQLDNGAVDEQSLGDDFLGKADVIDLCARAATPYGDTAAVCIWPRFVPLAKQKFTNSAIRIATVVNFPHGGEDTASVIAETDKAIADGADEIDMVMAYRLVADRPAEVETQIGAVREAARARVLKVIVETGELKDPALIRQAAEIAIAAGADFIKTSTGKITVNATPEAARTMLTVIAGHDGRIGFKPAGGIRTLDDAALYFGLADEILGPDWARPETFRIGASSVLDALKATLEDRAAQPGSGSGGGY